MVKKNGGGSALGKAATCPPELIEGHVSKWGVAKLHMKERLVRAAGRLSRGRSWGSEEPPVVKYEDDKPVVLVGPVIGLVSKDTARILLEVDRNAMVEMSVQKVKSPPQEDLSLSESFVASVSQRLWRIKSSPAVFDRTIHSERAAFVRTGSGGSKENSTHSQQDSSIHSSDDTGSSNSSKMLRRRKSSILSMHRASSMDKSLLRKSNAEIGNEASSEMGSLAEYGSIASDESSMEKKAMKHTSAKGPGSTNLRKSRRGSPYLMKLWRRSSLNQRSSPWREPNMHYHTQGTQGDDTTVTIAKQMEARRPCIFEFTSLESDSLYKVEVKECHDAERSSFKTLSSNPMQTFCMASISCNSIFITKHTITSIDDLWGNLAKSIRLKQVNLLIHLGDQIYGDGDPHLEASAGKDRNKWSNRFKIAREMLKGMDNKEWHSKQEEICEKYREVYRDTWKHPPTAQCLANCPSLMIYDDHEIRDNWGDNPLDCRRECVEFFIAECAWRVALEYQRQLHENVDFSNLKAIKKDHHFHVIGKIGLMFLDIRGSRTFHRVKDDKTPYLGSSQWEDIKQALADGLFRDIKVLVVCSPAPLVFLVPVVTRAAHTIAADRLEDFKGHWSSYKSEQKKMIDCLRQWKESRKGREVIILGGDVHCGGHSCIIKNNETLFYQLTTSPIANMPLPKTAYYAMRFAEQLEQIQEGFRFRHFNWTRARNYGLVQVNFRGREGNGEVAEIIMQLVRGKFLRPVRMGKRVSNLEVYTCTVCSSMNPVQWCKTRMFNVAFTTCGNTLLSGSSRKHESKEKDDE